MKNKNIYVTKRLIETNNQSELDFDLYAEFNVEEYDDFVEIEPEDNYKNCVADSTPIRIDDMIKILQDFQKNKATHIQLEEDGDHHGYWISAFKIENSTPDEIEAYELKYKNYNKKVKEIQELQNKIDEIKKS